MIALQRHFCNAEAADSPICVDTYARQHLEHCWETPQPPLLQRFIGHITSALPTFLPPIAKLMVALSQNLVKLDTSDVFTPMGRQVIAMMHKLA